MNNGDVGPNYSAITASNNTLLGWLVYADEDAAYAARQQRLVNNQLLIGVV